MTPEVGLGVSDFSRWLTIDGDVSKTTFANGRGGRSLKQRSSKAGIICLVLALTLIAATIFPAGTHGDLI